MVTCILHNSSARRRGANNGAFFSLLLTFCKRPPVLAIGESGSHFHISGRCCLPCRLLKGASVTVPTSPYPTIRQSSRQSLMVRDVPQNGNGSFGRRLFLRFRVARALALFDFEKWTETGNFLVFGWLGLVMG